MKNEEVCPKCGYDWLAHEFAVPAPYCPSNDENAQCNRSESVDLREIIERMKAGVYKSPFKKE